MPVRSTTTGAPPPISHAMPDMRTWRRGWNNDGVIDLRSDTKTQPTPGMRQAIASAVVGDEQRREDPTVLDLERRAAELLGQEESVFVPTATMANEIALRIHTLPGDLLLAEEHSHVLIAEQGGPAVHAGLLSRP